MHHGNEGHHSVVENDATWGMGLLHLLVLVPDYQIDAAVGEHQLLQILFLGVFDAVRKSAVET